MIGQRALIAGLGGAVTGLATLAAPVADAGPDRVAFPSAYATDFVRYETVDKSDRKIVRFLYVNRDALAGMTDGEFPSGTVIVMEDHKAQLGPDGTPLVDANGRFVPESAVANIFVMEKRTGWGAAYAEEIRNGDWDYAWFLADGARKPDAKFDRCFSCHKGQESADFTFTTADFARSVR